MKNIGYIKSKNGKFKNIIIAVLLVIITITTAAAINIQTSRHILQRDYRLLESRYTTLYTHSLQTSNQD